MIVKSINLKNFRNYDNQFFEFDEKLNIIHGFNAQGKTNILEGIYFFSTGKSGRTKKEAETIKFGEEKATLQIVFQDKNRENKAEIEIFQNKRKNIYLNEILLKKVSSLVGKFNAVYFGPEYLDLVKGGPSKRRKNIDIIISQLKPSYFSALTDYKKTIEQKNASLKNNNPNRIIIEILNEKLINLSDIIAGYRFEYIKKIEKLANLLQKQISDENENLEMDYISPIGVLKEYDSKIFTEEIRKKLEKNFEREIILREAQVGVHRDDIEYKINSQDAKSFASQGQQKTVVLAEKIAEAQLFYEEKGEYPVLLLDDIMSELDEKRQAFVMEKLKDMQIFITCTGGEILKKLGDGKKFEIEKGRLL